MTGKRNDHKERWLQENNDCNKAMTAKNRPLQRAVLEGSLARKLRFHMFSHLQLADFEGSLHESFHCTTSTCRCWRNLARKLRFHIFNSPILKKARAKAFLCTTSTCRFWKGSLARKLRFHQLAARSWGKHVPHHRLEPCQPIVAQILVLILPDSKLYFLFYYLYYLFLLPNSDYLCFRSQLGSARPMRSKTSHFPSIQVLCHCFQVLCLQQGNCTQSCFGFCAPTVWG